MTSIALVKGDNLYKGTVVLVGCSRKAHEALVRYSIKAGKELFDPTSNDYQTMLSTLASNLIKEMTAGQPDQHGLFDLTLFRDGKVIYCRVDLVERDADKRVVVKSYSFRVKGITHSSSLGFSKRFPFIGKGHVFKLE